MTKKKKILWISGAALATALVAGGAGVAVATTADNDEAVTGPAFERASKAALAEVGKGTVESVEFSDDGDHTYEVEVLLENNTEIEVELDDKFTVVRTETDDADSDNESDNDTESNNNTESDNGNDKTGSDDTTSDDTTSGDDSEGAPEPLTDTEPAPATP